MIRLGAPIFDPPADPRELARLHRQLGYSAAYVPTSLENANSATLREFAAAFAAEDVLLAEVGAWGNMADPARRAAHLEVVCRRLALADAVGARCCVNYLGSLSASDDFGPCPANFSADGFELAVQTVRHILDTVRPIRSFFALEFMTWCLPDSVDAMLALLDAIDRPRLAVHLDPANLIQSARQYCDTAAVIRDAFHRLGPLIVSCHAKDVIASADLTIHIHECPPGQGVLDYPTLLASAARLRNDLPIMLEHLPNAAAYAAAREHLCAVAHAHNIPIQT